MRLSRAGLAALDRRVALPAYEPAAHGIGVVHLGIGAFHRAHQAVYLDDLLGKIGGDWRAVGVSLRSPGVRDRLVPQDCLYTLLERGTESRARIIGSIASALVAPEDPAAVLRQLADPTVKLVTLTITERGYGHVPSTGQLDRAGPDIARDLERAGTPVTAVGYLVEALARRRAARHPAPVIVSCDNLPRNGALLKRLLVEFAGVRDPALATWIDRIPIPSSMVDRIVPATTPADIKDWEVETGLRDEALVVAEPFCQWLIEENGAEALAPLADIGVRFVPDIGPFELAKLRVVNACHSLLAFTGLLSGFELVDQAAGDPALADLARGFMIHEAAPTLPEAAVPDAGAILDRFTNPALRHRLAQIATDSPQKVPQRLLGTIKDLSRSNRPFARASLAIAAWLQLLSRADAERTAAPFGDPLSLELRRRCAHSNVREIVEDTTALQAVFGDVGQDPEFRAGLVRQLTALREGGLRLALTELAQG